MRFDGWFFLQIRRFDCRFGRLTFTAGLALALAGALATGLAVALAGVFATGLAADLATGLAAGLAAALATGFADALSAGFTADLTTGLATGFADGLATTLAVDFTAGLAAALLAGLAGVLVLVADTGLAFVTGLGAFLAVALGATFVVLGAGFLDLRSAGMGTPRLQRNKKSAPKTQRDNRKGKGEPLNGKGSGRTFGVQSLR